LELKNAVLELEMALLESAILELKIALLESKIVLFRFEINMYFWNKK